MHWLPRTAALLIPALMATGCSALSGDDGASQQDQVAVAFYPLEYAVSRVAGDHFDLVALTAPGKEPHDVELGIDKTAAVADSGLVVFESGFQPAVDRAVEQNATGRVLDVADVVDLVAAHRESSEESHDHEHESEHDHEAEEESHDGHDHGNLDPHFWLDPLLMADLTDAIAAELAEIDPDHADEFSDNAAAFREELETLDRDYADGLATCKRDTVVVNHDAFGYLTRYGLHFEDIVGLSPGAEATIADQRRLEDLVEHEGITTVFSERLASDKAARTLADDAGVRLDVLDPIEGLSDQTSGEDYLSLMRSNLTKLKEANGC
ncbi:metal ABC transporter substrate-binding protein [Nocardioides daejeonensis]|uniref:metal ABC transporter substrate-binding protein n=1 Tax=Nocardioides daejeonensis TaxID=1046556 RepID=UPI000D74B130|nr:metal ABC transporter substrate-binding protein [Nocardioides daejeonensis]